MKIKISENVSYELASFHDSLKINPDKSIEEVLRMDLKDLTLSSADVIKGLRDELTDEFSIIECHGAPFVFNGFKLIDVTLGVGDGGDGDQSYNYLSINFSKTAE